MNELRMQLCFTQIIFASSIKAWGSRCLWTHPFRPIAGPAKASVSFGVLVTNGLGVAKGRRETLCQNPRSHRTCVTFRGSGLSMSRDWSLSTVSSSSSAMLTGGKCWPRKRLHLNGSGEAKFPLPQRGVWNTNFKILISKMWIIKGSETMQSIFLK